MNDNEFKIEQEEASNKRNLSYNSNPYYNFYINYNENNSNVVNKIKENESVNHTLIGDSLLSFSTKKELPIYNNELGSVFESFNNKNDINNLNRLYELANTKLEKPKYNYISDEDDIDEVPPEVNLSFKEIIKTLFTS